VPDAAARIAVDDLDQLGDGVPAIAHDVPRHPLGHRHHPAVDHQDAEVLPRLAGLDDDAGAEAARLLEGGPHLVGSLEVDRHGVAVMAVERLDDHRVAQPFRLGDRVLGVVDHRLARHRQAELLQDLVGQPLVGGDLDGDLPGLAGDRGLDTLLIFPVAELHQRAFVQTDPGNVLLLGGAHQGRRGRPHGVTLGDVDQLLELGPKIERRGIIVLPLGREQVADDAQGQFGRREPDLLLDVAVDHVVLTGG
jgi:hypothetical protein